jgi:hypothetical protein
VIKLKDPNNVASTIADITDNPKKLRFVELDAAQLPRSLQDVDLVSINNNYAVQAGLNPAVDAIAREAADGPWVNIIAVREEDKDKPWVKQLVDAYHSEPVKGFLEKRFKGTYIATALIRSDYVETIDNARTFRSGISSSQTCKCGIEWDLCVPGYRAVLLRNELSTSDGHHQRMSVSMG